MLSPLHMIPLLLISWGSCQLWIADRSGWRKRIKPPVPNSKTESYHGAASDAMEWPPPNHENPRIFEDEQYLGTLLVFTTASARLYFWHSRAQTTIIRSSSRCILEESRGSPRSLEKDNSILALFFRSLLWLLVFTSSYSVPWWLMTSGSIKSASLCILLDIHKTNTDQWRSIPPQIIYLPVSKISWEHR